MASPPAKSRRAALTAADRADLALLRQSLREMEERGEKPIPWEEVERSLDELNAREDEAAAAEREQKRPRAVPVRTRAAAPKAAGSRRRAASGRER